MLKFVSDVEGFDGLRRGVENPHGAAILSIGLTDKFGNFAGEPFTTAELARAPRLVGTTHSL